MAKKELTTEMISSVPCPLCGSQAHIKLFETFDHEYKTTDLEFPLNACANCDVKFLSPRPNLRSLEIIYPDSYNNFSISESADQSYVRKISNSIQTSRIKSLIEKYYPHSQDQELNVLDVGCGDGYILDRVKEAFPNFRTYGVEPNRKAAQIASRRHQIFEGVFEDYKSAAKFDLIFSSHVVEHVESPIKFLKEIGESLRSDGVAIIDTPNIDCLQYRIFKRNWGGIHSPRHWTLFDQSTIAAAAKSAGLNVVATIQMPINIYWVWSIHAFLYSKGYQKIADQFFNTTDCVSKKSLYYFFVMCIGEFLERLTGLFKLGLGQQRVIIKNAGC